MNGSLKAGKMQFCKTPRIQTYLFGAKLKHGREITETIFSMTSCFWRYLFWFFPRMISNGAESILTHKHFNNFSQASLKTDMMLIQDLEANATQRGPDQNLYKIFG